MSEIALALGGGGIKGIAHIGVINRLEKEGFRIRAVAGTSAGGLVGAIYAAGYSVEEISEVMCHIDQSRMFTRGANDGPSLLGIQGIVHTLSNLLGNCTFQDLKLPFACTAVDIKTAKEMVFTNGSLMDAIEATIAVPGIFPPKVIGPYMLVDGSVLDPVPVKLTRYLSPTLPVIAICLTPEPDEWKYMPTIKIPVPGPIPSPIIEQFSKMRIGQAAKIFSRSMDITSHMVAELRLQIDLPDVLIRPDVERLSILDKVYPKELISIGEAAVENAIPILKQALSWPNQISRQFRKGSLPGEILIN